MLQVLAVGAHPDDVEFGCGGVLAKHRIKGDSITIVTVSDGRLGGDPQIRASEQRRSAAMLDAKLILLDCADGKIGPEVTEQIVNVTDSLHPDIVYTHRGDEIHQDHVQVFQAVKVAARDVRSLLLFESPRSSAFATGVFADISSVMDEKLALIACHESQTTRGLLLTEDAIRARAILHGVHAGVQFAEQFEPVRLAWDFEPLSQDFRRIKVV